MDGTFEEYVAARGDGLLRFAYLLCGDRHLAEDLVQEVLARVHDRWPRLSYVEQPDAYLRTAIVRQFVSWRRRRSRRETSLELIAEPAGSGADAATRHAARDEMWRLLETLPRRQRAVLVLRFYEDLADMPATTGLRSASTPTTSISRSSVRRPTPVGACRHHRPTAFTPATRCCKCSRQICSYAYDVWWSNGGSGTSCR